MRTLLLAECMHAHVLCVPAALEPALTALVSEATCAWRALVATNVDGSVDYGDGCSETPMARSPSRSPAQRSPPKRRLVDDAAWCLLDNTKATGTSVRSATNLVDGVADSAPNFGAQVGPQQVRNVATHCGKLVSWHLLRSRTERSLGLGNQFRNLARRFGDLVPGIRVQLPEIELRYSSGRPRAHC